MKSLLSIILVASSLFASAQDLQKEINEQVWRPFIAGFTNGDTELFMSVHSRDLVRSPRDDKSIMTWNEYYAGTKSWNDQKKSSGGKTRIELRFTERIANASQAINVGIYKTTSIRSNGEERSFYGRFHVVMRKEAGVWKILVDTDSSEGNTIGEEDFAEATPME
jgi:ketosteroid isomerase-like protein